VSSLTDARGWITIGVLSGLEAEAEVVSARTTRRRILGVLCWSSSSILLFLIDDFVARRETRSENSFLNYFLKEK
jgi:hypothetical protein